MEDRCMMSLRSMMDTLVDAQKVELAKGVDSADTEESGKVIDMIKDLAQAQKYCWEACYYKTLIKAMEDADYQRMGYTQTPKQQAFMKDWLRDPEEFENRMRDKDHGEWPLSRRGSSGMRKASTVGLTGSIWKLGSTTRKATLPWTRRIWTSTLGSI